jgi:hypothetical protein
MVSKLQSPASACGCMFVGAEMSHANLLLHDVVRCSVTNGVLFGFAAARLARRIVWLVPR